MKNINDYKALTFDCYGTLIDWEQGIWDAIQPLIVNNDCTDVTRNMALEDFAQQESEQEKETPSLLYSEILKKVHQRLARHFSLETTADLDHTFGNSVQFWPAFPDTADALRLLKKQFKLVILSNVNRDGFAASNRKLGVTFDSIYTAEDIGSYKPSEENFDYLIKHIKSDLNINPDEILHTAQSLFHDHVPANRFNLATAWIDRQRLSEGGKWGATAQVIDRPKLDFIFFSIEEMATAVK